jgi:hypothetical protein
LIETAGGAHDTVYAIVYRSGEPTLAVKTVTKGTANVSISQKQLGLVIWGIYAGDAKPLTETHNFELSLEDLLKK